ncbi:MAG: sulfatase [Nitrospirae bacterium]|nr:sulfatase [Nitrospirota bacterium]
MKLIRLSLKVIGGLGLCSLVFFIVFVYPRPSRLPDPLLAIQGKIPVGGPPWNETIRLADLATRDALHSVRVSPKWDEGLAALGDYPYATDGSDSGRVRLQAGLGLLNRGEMEVMDALFAPTPTDLTYTVRIPAEGRLSLAMAVLPHRSRIPASARFIVRISGPSEGEGSPAAVTVMDRLITTPFRKNRISFRDMMQEYLFPDIRGKYGQWEKMELDLSRWEGRTVALTLSTRSPGDTREVSAAAWGNPVILGRTPLPSDQGPPNVIVILVDAMRPDAMGVYGSERNATPNMDRLAREGVVFLQARSASVDTRTSETSFFTGRYPNEIGVHYRNRGLDPLERRHFHSLSLPTLPDRFTQAGYLTGAFVNNLFLLEFSGAGYDLGFQEITNNNRATLDTVDLTDRTIGWLARNGRRPFFLFLNYNAPHGRYRPPVKHLFQAAGPIQVAGYDRYSWYLGSVAYVDEYVGVVRTALERLGLLDHTLIVITADHGQVFDPAHDYGVPDRDLRTFNRHGYTLYDEEIHVPLILRWPEKIAGGRRVDDPVSLVDVFPTVEELAGLSASKNLSGRSLVPLIQGRPLPPRPVYADGRYMKAVVRDGMKYITREGPASRLVRRMPEGNRLIHLREELFDLNRDPKERRNLIGLEDASSVAAAQRMRGLLRDEAAPDLTVNHLRLAAGDARHLFAGRVSVPERSGSRIRFFEALPVEPLPQFRQTDETTLEFSVDLERGRSTGFFFETQPPAAPVRLDLSMDGRPIEPGRLYGGPMGLSGLIEPGRTLPVPALAFLDSRSGIYGQPLYDPRYETGAFIWRTPYLDYVGVAGGNSGRLAGQAGLSGEVRDILFDWGYIQKDEKR